MLTFERQLTQAFPDRQPPDGWIADENHTGTSSHHPDDTPGSKPEWDGDPDNIPDVRGVDVWSNLGPGVNSRAVCNHLAGLPNLATVVRYFIHQGLIWHARNGFRPVAHDGDPHPTHIHVTFAFTEAADDNTTYDYRFEEVPVALTQADKEWFDQRLEAIEAKVAALGAKVELVPAATVDRSFARQGVPEGGTTSLRATAAWSDSNIRRVEGKVDEVLDRLPVTPPAPRSS